jgi:transposase
MRHSLTLTAADHTALEDLRDHAPKAYLRERAAAILKVADGLPAAEVARTGLLRPRDSDTLYAWLQRFETEGIAGLPIRPGRGRKPAFSPSAP